MQMGYGNQIGVALSISILYISAGLRRIHAYAYSSIKCFLTEVHNLATYVHLSY